MSILQEADEWELTYLINSYEELVDELREGLFTDTAIKYYKERIAKIEAILESRK